MIIRSYQKRDAAALARIRQALGKRETAVSLHRTFVRFQQADGHVWVGLEDGRYLGAITIAPLPGLPHLLSLNGFVAPEQQRKGYGSQLLSYVQQQLAGSGQQLTHSLTDLTSPAAHFLQQQGFKLGHEEWMMRLEVDKTAVFPPANHPSVTLRTLPRQQAASQFIKLYDSSFAPHPWYQPYTLEEVLDELDEASDIRFFYESDQPAGFLWLRQQGKVGEIEPVGIVPAAQGKGYGRWLLQTAVYQAAQQGIEQIELGVWGSNKTAVHLYQSLGFIRESSHCYFVQNV